MDNKNKIDKLKLNIKRLYNKYMPIIFMSLLGVGLMIMINAFIIQPTIKNYGDMFERIEQYKTDLRLKELRKDMCSIYSTDESKRCKDADERLTK